MDAFRDATPLWDFSSTTPYPQLHNDDFLSILQKQYSHTEPVPLTFSGGYPNSVNPQSISKFPLPTFTPPSEDSSPSPPNSNHDQYDDDGPALKRKASDDDLQEGPSQKNPNSNDKRSNTRRKSSGGTTKDEGRLLKRKEQNRAAQRAFRERKEKHVKDLEDKVAALEAKNDEAAHENENLRDLLSRLQSENVMLKQSSFTFSVPREASTNGDSTMHSFSSDMNAFPSSIASSSRSSVSSPTTSHSKSPKTSNPLEWSSLTTFDPSRLNLLDDIPQQTATTGAMQLDFGFGNTGLASNAPYTSLTSNPMFMSFASTFDSTMANESPNLSTTSNGNAFNFDMSSLSAWPTPVPNGQDSSALDDLLQGYLGNTDSLDYSFLTSPAAISPVNHRMNVVSHSASSSSSPSSSTSDPLFTPKDTATPESDFGEHHDESQCPKTKAELIKRIEASGPSPFAPVNPVRKSTDQVLGSMITCAGSSFPKTQKSDQNIEVLSAWRSITSNPKFKDADITELCSEFTSKARCDGTKVVLEPDGVHSILEHLSKKQ